ncbi:hypothetical protein HOC13_01310 [Candidatus Woesearchaeota archaeon]|jgi:hypothetical protein|nr:hypothetical protein [Candidatus Woesearchaeota archaeon]
MNKKIILIGVIAVLILSLVIVFTVFKHDYRPATLDGDKCFTYTQDCTCFGSLLVMESFPLQYNCQGLEFCEEINVTECD